MKPRTVYLPADLLRRLQEKSRKTGVSQSELIRIAVEQSLAGSDKPLPRSFGVADSGRIGARNLDTWLDANWRRE